MENSQRNDHISDIAGAMLKTTSLIYRRTFRMMNKTCDGSGLTYPKIGILITLKDQGPLPLSVIAKIHSYSRQNLTTLTDQLEAEGLVRRSPDINDRRVINLELTDAGKNYIKENGKRMKQGLVQELERLDDMEIEALRSSFETIARIYQKIDQAND